VTLIDTSVWIRVLRGDADPGLAGEVQALLLREGAAAWCPLVELELWAGVRNGDERSRLAVFRDVLRSLAIEPATWAAAIDLADRARRRGTTVPPSDLVIFACATQHRATLLHRDRHFELLIKLCCATATKKTGTGHLAFPSKGE
jgi:predicted nucleic acid-binding protein